MFPDRQKEQGKGGPQVNRSDALSLARNLVREHDRGDRFKPFAKSKGINTLADAYDVQDQFVLELVDRYGEIVGFKIGLTSPAMQQFCGIDQPISGAVLSKRVLRSGAAVKISDFGRLGLEFEIAVRIGRDTTPRSSVYSAETIASHVDAICAAIELVDDRAADYTGLDVLSLLADNSWNGGIVLSEFRDTWPDLAPLPGRVRKDLIEIDMGHGRDVLGHPFNSLAWLANHLGSRGRKLEAGQVVLTGSLVKTIFPGDDATYRFDLQDVGTVEVNVSK
jgi:2-keto-4-pentenoate hydratase